MKRAILAALIMAAGSARAEGRYAPVNGLELYYEVHGAARGKEPPLVLLHGGGSTIESSFAKILPRLARTRQVIAIEAQGHGHTADILDRPFTFEQSADDAAALLAYLKVEKADVLGYSNGGTTALHIAIRHPGVVRRLVIVSASFKRDGLPPEFWEGMKHATLETMPRELKEAYLGVAPHPEQLQSMHDKSVRRMLEFKDIPEASMRAIAAPTLVLVGDRDVVRVEHAAETMRLLPHAQLAVVPATDHLAMAEWKGAQAEMIEAFLR